MVLECSKKLKKHYPFKDEWWTVLFEDPIRTAQ